MSFLLPDGTDHRKSSGFVVVGKAELTKEEANQVLATVVGELSCDPNTVKVIPYV